LLKNLQKLYLLKFFCHVIAAAEENKKNVFVKNIAWAIAEDELKELFSGCKNVRMPKRPDGSSRG